MKWEAVLLRASCAAVALWVIAGIVSDGFRDDGSDSNMAVAMPPNTPVSPGPGQGIIRRQLDLFPKPLSRFGDIQPQVTTPNVHKNPAIGAFWQMIRYSFPFS